MFWFLGEKKDISILKGGLAVGVKTSKKMGEIKTKEPWMENRYLKLGLEGGGTTSQKKNPWLGRFP